ncbi:MAG: redoxin domain-containing protein [Phycisphaerales bacterium]|nr:redoxin domain-containing protein [Phycisphaerales bacterium]
MTRLGRTLVCVGVMLASCGLALGQTAQEVLQAAAERLHEEPKLRASMTIHGEGAEMFRAILPRGEATLLLRRVEGEPAETQEPAAHWEGRVTGKSTTGSPNEPDPVDLDFIEKPETHRWIDHAKKRVFDMVPARAMSSRSTAYSVSRMLLPNELMQIPAFKNEFEAEELALLDPADVNGVKCDVVELTYPKVDNARANPTKPQQVKLFIGKDDHRLYRVERISGADMFKTVAVLEFSNWKPDETIGDKDFELPVPEGYQLEEAKPVAVRPTATRQVEQAPRPAQVEQQRPQTPQEVHPPAPEFALSLATGEHVTLESLRGTTTVLYFWGTWCLECREYNPQMSKLAEEVAGQPVRVIAAAVRERDPATARDLVAMRDYKFEIAPDAAGAAEAFHVTTFPTFVVIDPEGGLVGTEVFKRNTSSGPVMARVKELISKASPEVKVTIPPSITPPSMDEDEIP